MKAICLQNLINTASIYIYAIFFIYANWWNFQRCLFSIIAKNKQYTFHTEVCLPGRLTKEYLIEELSKVMKKFDLVIRDEKSSVMIVYIQWNLFKPNLLGTNLSIQNRLVFGLYRLNKQRFSILMLYLKFGLYRILVYWGFSLDRFHCTKIFCKYRYMYAFSLGKTCPFCENIYQVFNDDWNVSLCTLFFLYYSTWRMAESDVNRSENLPHLTENYNCLSLNILVPSISQVI